MRPSLVIASILRDVENKAQIFKTLQEKLKEYITTFYKLAIQPICNTMQVQMFLELTGPCIFIIYNKFVNGKNVETVILIYKIVYNIPIYNIYWFFSVCGLVI